MEQSDDVLEHPPHNVVDQKNGEQNSGAENPSSGKPVERVKTQPYDWEQFLSNKDPKEYLHQQTVIYDEEKGIRCSPLVKDGKLLEYIYEDARTQHEIFLRGLKVSNNGNCVGYRPGPDQPYKWLTYQEILDRVRHFGSGLIAKGAKPDPEQFIGIYSKNRVEWTVAEKTCDAYSMVIVPLYDTLGPQAMQFIVNQCQLKFIVVDQCSKALILLKDSEISLKTIILVEEISDEVREKAAERDVEVVTFSEVENLGKKINHEFVPPKPEDLHTICYTSGTTGNPKGVMLTHGAYVAGSSAVFSVGSKGAWNVGVGDIYISYLPLAHSLEKLLQAMTFMHGGSIGFYQGDIKLLKDDLLALRPTIFPLVPRLLNRLYDKVMAGANESRVKKFLFNLALKKKLALLEKGIVTKNTIWDKLVFKKVQNSVGGRVRICATGAAPISPTVLNFMRCALGVPLAEGYGLTETVGSLSATVPGDYKGGNAGTIMPCCFAKLVDVPEKNYFAKNNQGEICVKGRNIFLGYYKEEEKTRQTIDEDGWVHTGDVGEWLPNGSLKIFDRSKHIFKLSIGEYIAPEKIEQIYVQSAPVAQVFVYGESLKASLVAIVIPDVETVESWCRSRNVRGGFEEICESPEATSLILNDINDVGRRNGLLTFELVKKIHLSTELFSVENDLLTPSFKSRRPQLYQRYKDVIVRMFEGLD